MSSFFLNASDADGALVWSRCSGFDASPVLPISNDTRVCGYFTQTPTLLAQCCNAALQQYECWTFCSSSTPIQDFQSCIKNQTNGNYSATDVFCQAGLESNIKESLHTSASFKNCSAPRISWIVFAVLFVVLFIDPTAATIVPSLDTTGVVRRQNSACTFSQDQVYARGARQLTVSPVDDSCNSADTCVHIYDVDTGINNNNRTIRAAADPGLTSDPGAMSAADPQYDHIFEIVGDATKRMFPAQSSLQTRHELVSVPGKGYLTWIPFHFCVNGTITNCAGVLGDTDDPSTHEFCGPIFVTNLLGEMSPQGSFRWVTTQ